MVDRNKARAYFRDPGGNLVGMLDAEFSVLSFPFEGGCLQKERRR
jgi:hypothetical protein